MESTAQSSRKTTLYLSELANGLVFTLAIKDTKTGEHEKHVWKTSYPLLDLLYPHWVPKRSVNTPINFLSQAISQAGAAFGWKLVTESGHFIVPEKSFGEGIDRVSMLQESSTSGLVSGIVSDKFVSMVKRKDLSIGKLLLQDIEGTTEPVVVVVANFYSIEVIECIPRIVGKMRKWEYKSSKIQYANEQEFVDMLATKKFLPFVGEHMPEGQIFNTLLNYIYWRPLTTSSLMVRDIWRALLTSQLIELGKYLSVQQFDKGHVYITGEVPLFVHDNPRLQLAAVDGLGLSGAWTVLVDEHYQMLPFLAEGKENNVFNELSAEKSSLWIIPQIKKQKSIVKVKFGESEYQGLYGNLYTYSIRSKSHVFEYDIDGQKSTIELPKYCNVASVTIDTREWPVVYGPNTVANSVKIPQWVDRIRKQIKT